jgi:hypothetical protein
MRLYHCTSRADAATIMAEGFCCGTSGLAGGGIYFAETVEAASRKAHQHGVVLVCDVDLGRVFDTGFNGDSTLNIQRLNRMGYNSVRLPRNGTEYCVYEPHRVRVVGERHDPQKIASLKMMAHLARLQGCTDAAELFASMADDMEAGQPDWSLVAKNGPPPPCNPSTMPPSLLCTLHPHPLKKLPAVYTGVYSCDVCDGTGHGWVFHCDACSWDAHPACAAQHCSPPPTTRGGG